MESVVRTRVSEKIVRICCKRKRNGSATTVKGTVHVTDRKGDIVVVRFLGKGGRGRLAFLDQLRPRVGVFHFTGSSRYFRTLSRRTGRRRDVGLHGKFGCKGGIIAANTYSVLVLSRMLKVISRGIVDPRRVYRLFTTGPRRVALIYAKHILSRGVHRTTSRICGVTPRG